MARTGLTNFVVWALACLFVGYFVARDEQLLFVAAVALAVAALTRYWPEALGVAAGTASLLLLHGAAPAAIVAIAGFAIWRFRVGGLSSSDVPNGASTPRRLTVATLLASVAVFVFGAVLLLRFGFTCQSDTSQATPGSDRAAWCDALFKDDLAVVLLFGPPALVFLGGLFTASRGRAREVLITAIAGFVLTIGVHIPDFVLSNAAP